MTIPLAEDGKTDLDSSFFNPVIASGTSFTINAQVAPNTGAVLRCGWLIEDRTP